MKLESVRRSIRRDRAEALVQAIKASFLLEAGPKAQAKRSPKAGDEWFLGYWTGRLVQADDDRERLKKVPL